MPDYQKMYFKLAHAADDAAVPNQQAASKLIEARQATEELFIEADDTPLRVAPTEPSEPE